MNIPVAEEMSLRGNTTALVLITLKLSSAFSYVRKKTRRKTSIQRTEKGT